MKRSEVNAIVYEAEQLLREYQFQLPPWAFWSLEDWKANASMASRVQERGLGWDVTDFGLGKYREKGLVLFTLRNGEQRPGKKPYAEKVFISKEEQETPYHYHWQKIEDIVNRGGGVLELQTA